MAGMLGVAATSQNTHMMRPYLLHIPDRLQVVPPLFDDELLSSWILRTAAYYQLNEEWIGLLAEKTGHVSCAPGVVLSAFDVSPPDDTLQILSGYTGYSCDTLRRHTLAGAFPQYRIVHFACMPGHEHLPAQSKPGFCPQCLDEMESESTGMYLRQDWALARRTMCQRHRSPLRSLRNGLRPYDALWRAEGGAVFNGVDFARDKTPRPASTGHLIWQQISLLEESCAAALDGNESTVFPGAVPATPEQLEQFFADLASIWTARNASAIEEQTEWTNKLPFPSVEWKSFCCHDLIVRQGFFARAATYLYTSAGFHEVAAGAATLRELAAFRKRITLWPAAIRPLVIDAIHGRGLFLANEKEIREKKEIEFAFMFPRSAKAREFWRRVDFDRIYRLMMPDHFTPEPARPPTVEVRPPDRYHQMALTILATNEGRAACRLRGRARAKAIGKLAREALNHEEPPIQTDPRSVQSQKR